MHYTLNDLEQHLASLSARTGRPEKSTRGLPGGGLTLQGSSTGLITVYALAATGNQSGYDALRTAGDVVSHGYLNR